MASASQGCVDRIWILHKALKGRLSDSVSERLSGDGGPMESSGGSSRGSKKSNMSDEDWEEMDLRAASAIRLNLAKNILANVHGILTTKSFGRNLKQCIRQRASRIGCI